MLKILIEQSDLEKIKWHCQPFMDDKGQIATTAELVYFFGCALDQLSNPFAWKDDDKLFSTFANDEVHNKRLAVVNFFIDAGIDVKALGAQNETFLDRIALSSFDTKQKCKAAQRLIDKGINIHSISHWGKDALGLAIDWCDAGLADCLLQNGAIADAQQWAAQKWEILREAIIKNALFIFTKLLDDGYFSTDEINQVMEPSNGQMENIFWDLSPTPLYMALHWDRVKIIQKMLDFGADPDACAIGFRQFKGEIAPILATACWGQTSNLLRLLGSGANPNVTAELMNTQGTYDTVDIWDFEDWQNAMSQHDWLETLKPNQFARQGKLPILDYDKLSSMFSIPIENRHIFQNGPM